MMTGGEQRTLPVSTRGYIMNDNREEVAAMNPMVSTMTVHEKLTPEEIERMDREMEEARRRCERHEREAREYQRRLQEERRRSEHHQD